MIIDNGVLIKYEEGDIDQEGCCIIPKDVTSIGPNAFEWCENLKNITIPDNVTSIEESAFSCCKNLQGVVISNGVSVIGDSVFSSCSSLQYVTLPNGVTRIGDRAFNGCRSLTDIKIPSSVTSIGNDAFFWCKSLDKIEIPESVTFIGLLAFGGCSGLSNVVLPKNIKNVNYDSFFNNTLVQSTSEDNQTLKVYAGIGSLLQYYNLSDEIKSLNCEFVKRVIMKDELLSPLTMEKYMLPDYYSLMYNLGLFSSKDTLIEKSNKSTEPILNTGYNILRILFSEDNKLEENLMIKNVHIHFQYIKPVGVNEEFIKFMSNKNNIGDIINVELDQPGFITKVLNWFEIRKNMSNLGEIEDTANLSCSPTSEANRYKIRRYETTESGADKIKWKVPTVELLLREFEENKFMGVTEETRGLAEYLSEFRLYRQKHFNKAVEITNERKGKQIPDHILGEPLKQSKWESYKQCEAKMEKLREQCLFETNNVLSSQTDIADKVFTYEMLARSDNANFAIGFLTSCCATLYGSGAGAMRAMIVDDRIQPMVIRDSNDKIVSLGIIYVNKNEGYAVINNLELNQRYKDCPEQCRAIYDKAIEGVDAFVNKYNEKHSDKPIKIVTCGISPNWDKADGVNAFIGANPESAILSAPDFKDYRYSDTGYWSGDWFESQYIIWQEPQNLDESESKQSSIKQPNKQGEQVNEQQYRN